MFGTRTGDVAGRRDFPPEWNCCVPGVRDADSSADAEETGASVMPEARLERTRAAYVDSSLPVDAVRCKCGSPTVDVEGFCYDCREDLLRRYPSMTFNGVPIVTMMTVTKTMK
jgi:hypothetical protein